MRYFVECGGPSRRLERRSFVLDTHVPYAFASESVQQRECRVPLRESLASDARFHLTCLHLPSMSLASIRRSLMRHFVESGGPLLPR